uniref:Uncharacterized protein n=1 Tax=Tanacetum cinerariifolium TaxID=118510 RepID=A0A6L2KJ99_TANCI|nr:hypothetical protein [Tanacetum cinerariifolium]
MSWYSRCSWCGGPFNGENCRRCTNVSFRDEFVHNTDPISNDETPDLSYPPSQPQTSSFDQLHCFGCKTRLKKVNVVNGVLASGVDMVLEKDFASSALQKIEIHPLTFLIRTLSIILQTFSPTLHSSSTGHTRVNYVGTILTMVMIVHHSSCLSMSRNRVTIKTLVIIIIHKIHRDFYKNIFAVKIMKGPYESSQSQPMNLDYFEPNPSYNSNYSSFDQPTQYSINHQKDFNQQRISDVHDRWDKIEESHTELLNMMQSFCEMVIQQKQAANIDQ